MKNKLKKIKSDYQWIFWRTYDLEYFADEIKKFQNNLRKGQVNAKELTGLIRDIKRNAKDIENFTTNLMEDHLGVDESKIVIKEIEAQKLKDEKKLQEIRNRAEILKKGLN